jgi:outer membrane immunogenic protein
VPKKILIKRKQKRPNGVGAAAMKYPVFAIIAAMMIAGSSHAFAQSAPSIDAILKRLDALERENRVLRDQGALERENRALRDQVRLLTRGKSNTAAVAPTSPPLGGAASMAMAPAASRGPVYKASNPSPVIPYNWTGLYVGAHFGGGLAQSQWTDNNPIFCSNLPCPANEAGSHNATGLLGGVQLGYNWQFGHWVLGVEGQYSFAQLNGDHQNNVLEVGLLGPLTFTSNSVDRLTSKIDGIGTIAGRIGFASESMDRTLFFVKGGAAFARKQYADQFNAVGTLCDGAGLCGVFVTDSGAFNGSQNNWGWMAGIGLEYGLTENWSANIEYNYLGFGTKTVNLQGTNCQQTFSPPNLTCTSISRPFDINQNMQLLKFGVNYHFN